VNNHIRSLCLLFLIPGVALAQPSADAFGDPLPEGAIARLGTVRWRADGPIMLAVMPDAKSALTVTEGLLVQSWDLATGKEQRRFDLAVAGSDALPRFASRSMRTVAVSRDGRRIAFVGGDRNVHIWDAALGKDLANVTNVGGDMFYGVGLSGDGGTLVTTSMLNGTQVRKLDRADVAVRLGEAGRRPGIDLIASQMQLSPDGKTLLQIITDRASGARRPTLVIWDTETAKEKRRITELPGGDRLISSNSVIASPDLRTVALLMGRNVIFASSEDGKEVGRIEADAYDRRRAFAFTPDGKSFLWAGGPGEPITMWDVPGGKVVRQIGKMPERSLSMPNFSQRAEAQAVVAPDGKSLLFCAISTISVINLETGEPLNRGASHPGAVTEVAFAPSGVEVFTRGGDPVVRRWDARSGKEVDRLHGPVDSRAFVLSPDGHWFASASADGRAALVDAATLKAKHALGDGARSPRPALAFSPDSRLAAVALAARRAVQVVDTRTGEKVAKLQLGEALSSDEDVPAGILDFGALSLRLNFSASGSRLAIASERLVTIWEMTRGRQVGQIPLGEETLQHAVLSPDGQTVALETTAGTSVWEVATCTRRMVLHRNATRPRDRTSALTRLIDDEQGTTSPLAYSPDGRLLSRAGADRKVRVFDTWTGLEVGSFQGHWGDLTCTAFAPDGRRLATGSADTTVLVWDLGPVHGKLKRPATSLDEEAAEAAWSDLLEHDAARAYNAIRKLAGDPAKAVPFLRELIEPATGPDPKLLAKLIADLGNPRFAVREKAGRALDRLGDGALQALRDAAEKDPSAEVRKAAKKLLENFAAQAPTRDQVRAIRTVEVLERAGTPQAVELLKKIAGGGDDIIPTPQAKAALERVGAKK
jgi:WD40 repeat protein